MCDNNIVLRLCALYCSGYDYVYYAGNILLHIYDGSSCSTIMILAISLTLVCSCVYMMRSFHSIGHVFAHASVCMCTIKCITCMSV